MQRQHLEANYKMKRKFTIAGPCQPERHYMLPADERLPEVPQLIEDQLYFVVHGPRQTGKTTALEALAQQLTASGDYTAVLVSTESGAPFSNDIGAAELAILDDWKDVAISQLPSELRPPPWPDTVLPKEVTNSNRRLINIQRHNCSHFWEKNVRQGWVR